MRALSQGEKDELFKSLNHGVDLLDSDSQMKCYLFSYGGMHQAKVYKALESIDISTFGGQDLDIVDWGCGQGLATVCFFDYLRKNRITCNVNKITLIEPSHAVLERAAIHIGAYIADKNVTVSKIEKYLDDVTTEDISGDCPFTIHFFSNILDIDTIDLRTLANKVGSNVHGEHYIFCIGPMNNGNRRIDRFYEYFSEPETLMDETNAEYHYEDSKCTYNIKVFKLEDKHFNRIAVEYVPDVQFFASYQLDAIRNLTADDETKKKINALYRQLSGFEVCAPFDLGASVYDDVDPILAVLNNMIERGLPTRTSPFIEEAFSPLGNHKVDDGLGGLNYNTEGLEANDILLALHAIDGRFSFDDKTYRTKVLESDFEKNFIFNSAPAHLRQILMPQRSLISITGKKAHHSQRVDFACEFPYPSLGLDGREKHGLVIELDGAQYHNDDQTRTADNLRTSALEQSGWNCLRLRDLNDFDPESAPFDNEYFNNVKKAFEKEFDATWVNALQFTLSPVGMARIQKTLIEALISGKVDYKKETLSILAIERDVPCVALALRDFAYSFDSLASLSEEYKDVVIFARSLNGCNFGKMLRKRK